MSRAIHGMRKGFVIVLPMSETGMAPIADVESFHE
jgi:hypothetical protein